MIEFKKFPKIERRSAAALIECHVTQKIHGTNAQLLITENGDLLAGSRSRWLSPEHDNYGFAAWAKANEDELVRMLGPGRHYGEWAGPGINSGEGLSHRMFVLFDWWQRPEERPIPAFVTTVPLLYCGMTTVPLLYCGNTVPDIDAIMRDLRVNGSKLVPGYMRPEGVVVTVNGVRTKFTFEQEDVPWKEGKPQPGYPREIINVDHLLHRVRMEKVISNYIGEQHGAPLPKRYTVAIIDDYVADLRAEGFDVPTSMVGALRQGAFRLANAVWPWPYPSAGAVWP